MANTLLDFDLFRPIWTSAGSSSAYNESPIFEFETAGARATTRETEDAFIVLAEAIARKEGTPTFPETYRVLRDQLVKDGKLVDGPESGLYRFAVDVPFLSPSAAASVVSARSASGPREWKLRGTSQTYKAWRSARPADQPNKEQPAALTPEWTPIRRVGKSTASYRVSASFSRASFACAFSRSITRFLNSTIWSACERSSSSISASVVR